MGAGIPVTSVLLLKSGYGKTKHPERQQAAPAAHAATDSRAQNFVTRFRPPSSTSRTIRPHRAHARLSLEEARPIPGRRSQPIFVTWRCIGWFPRMKGWRGLSAARPRIRVLNSRARPGPARHGVFEDRKRNIRITRIPAQRLATRLP